MQTTQALSNALEAATAQVVMTSDAQQSKKIFEETRDFLKAFQLYYFECLKQEQEMIEGLQDLSPEAPQWVKKSSEELAKAERLLKQISEVLAKIPAYPGRELEAAAAVAELQNLRSTAFCIINNMFDFTKKVVYLISPVHFEIQLYGVDPTVSNRPEYNLLQHHKRQFFAFLKDYDAGRTQFFNGVFIKHPNSHNNVAEKILGQIIRTKLHTMEVVRRAQKCYQDILTKMGSPKVFTLEENFNRLLTLAKAGNASAQYCMGLFYLNELVPENVQKEESSDNDLMTSLKWFKLAAEKGNMYAQETCGFIYYTRQEELIGSAKGKDEAEILASKKAMTKDCLQYFKLAAEQDNLSALYELHEFYTKCSDNELAELDEHSKSEPDKTRFRQQKSYFYLKRGSLKQDIHCLYELSCHLIERRSIPEKEFEESTVIGAGCPIVRSREENTGLFLFDCLKFLEIHGVFLHRYTAMRSLGRRFFNNVGIPVKEYDGLRTEEERSVYRLKQACSYLEKFLEGNKRVLLSAFGEGRIAQDKNLLIGWYRKYSCDYFPNPSPKHIWMKLRELAEELHIDSFNIFPPVINSIQLAGLLHHMDSIPLLAALSWNHSDFIQMMLEDEMGDFLPSYNKILKQPEFAVKGPKCTPWLVTRKAVDHCLKFDIAKVIHKITSKYIEEDYETSPSGAMIHFSSERLSKRISAVCTQVAIGLQKKHRKTILDNIQKFAEEDPHFPKVSDAEGRAQYLDKCFQYTLKLLTNILISRGEKHFKNKQANINDTVLEEIAQYFCLHQWRKAHDLLLSNNRMDASSIIYQYLFDYPAMFGREQTDIEGVLTSSEFILVQYQKACQLSERVWNQALVKRDGKDSKEQQEAEVLQAVARSLS